MFHRDCDMTLVSAVQERKWQGLDFATDMVRVYHYPVICRKYSAAVGKIQSGDEEYYSSLGYAMERSSVLMEWKSFMKRRCAGPTVRCG